MLLEGITEAQTVGRDSDLSRSILAHVVQQASANKSSDDAPASEVAFSPTPQLVWPRVWPGL